MRNGECGVRSWEAGVRRQRTGDGGPGKVESKKWKAEMRAEGDRDEGRRLETLNGPGSALNAPGGKGRAVAGACAAQDG